MADKDFIIENGVLVEYAGLGGDVVIPDDVTRIGGYVFSWNKKLTSVVIPTGVTSIDEHAFYGCTKLTSVVIPNGVTSIGEYAFGSCTKLKSILIPASVVSIGKYALSWNDKLTKITVDENNKNYKSIKGSLYSKDGKTLIQYAIGKSSGTFVIPDSVTSIGAFAFLRCKRLISVVIGDSVTSIGEAAFRACYKLRDVLIGNNVTSIGKYAFFSCNSLISITVDENNENYKSIDGNLYSKDGKTLIQYAMGNAAWEGFEIPYGVTSIADGAFWGWGLEGIIIHNGVKSIGDEAFEGKDFTIYGYVGSYAEAYAKRKGIAFEEIDWV